MFIELDDFLRPHLQASVALDENITITHNRFPPPDYTGPECGFQINNRLKTVRLQDGNLLRVHYVVENPSNDYATVSKYYLRGWIFESIDQSRGMLSESRVVGKGYDEVYMQLDINKDHKGTDLQRGMVNIHIEDAIENVELIITNTTSDDTIHFSQDQRYVCRWISRSLYAYRPAGIRRKLKRELCEKSLARVRESEADREHRIKDHKLTLAWHGHLSSDTIHYTFADAFCGAGGASVAATLANLDKKWAFDWDRAATETYSLNFEDVEVYTASAEHMIALIGPDMRVDILHLSPPCQPYSSMNTKPNQILNEMNQASLFAVYDLVRLIKPRVVTLENTSTMVSHHPEWFAKLVNMLTDQDYSVRYKVVHFGEYGLVQKRKRVIIFASCPGGVLPDFPKPSHGPADYMDDDDDLEPFNTIEQVLAELEVAPVGSVSHHEPRDDGKERDPYPADKPLKHCIITGGADDYHPSGTREFTVRELAIMQGFPITFKLPAHQRDTWLRKQLGNAVPGTAFAPFLHQVALALEFEDVERSAIAARL